MGNLGINGFILDPDHVLYGKETEYSSGSGFIFNKHTQVHAIEIAVATPKLESK